MYFQSRADAGKQLAAKIMAADLPNVNRTVIALSDGAILVGEQIAIALHASLLMLSVEEITLPGELNPMAAVNQGGSITYNSIYSPGEIAEYTGEYNSFIQEERMRKVYLLNRKSSDTQISPNMLRRHIVILVADGLSSGFLLDVAADFLKPYKTTKLIIAVPFASVTAIDRMHVVGDQIFCLDIIDNYIFTDHYYEDNTMPTHDELVKNIQEIMLKWDKPELGPVTEAEKPLVTTPADKRVSQQKEPVVSEPKSKKRIEPLSVSKPEKPEKAEKPKQIKESKEPKPVKEPKDLREPKKIETKADSEDGMQGLFIVHRDEDEPEPKTAQAERRVSSDDPREFHESEELDIDR